MLRAVSALSASVGLLLFATFSGGTSALARADQTSVPQETLRSNPPSTFALTNARVVVSADVTLDSATIVVRNGKIEAVGDVKVPPDAKEISFAGKTVYPGFIDAYSELSVSSDRLEGSARYWNGQVTSQLSVADQIVAGEDLSTLRKQGIVARLVAPLEGVVRGTSALVSTSGSNANTALLKRDVAQHILLTLSSRRRGAGFPASPMGAVALARQVMYDAQWYRDATAAVAADPSLPLPEKNDSLASLQPVITGAMPVIVPASDEQFAARADRFASEFGLNLIIKGSGREYRRLDEIAATKRTLILPVAFPKAPNVATSEAADDATLESLLHWDIAPENPARVDAAGIRFALSTDGLESKGDFLKAVRKAVERGLSRTSALKALTSTPAELFGVGDQLGTIRTGHLASFVVTDGDLFDRKTKIVETWVSGTRFEHEPAKARKADGYYQLQVQQVGPFPGELFMEITEADGRLKGRISRQQIAKEEKKPRERGGRDGSSTEEKSSDEKSADAQASDTNPNVAKSDAEKSDDNTPPKTDGKGKSSAVAETKEPAEKSEETKEPKKDVLELQNLKLNDTLFTTTFNGKDWGFDGVIRLSITLTEPDSTVKDRAAGIGSIVWPDGSTAVVTAVHVDRANAKPDGESPNTPNEQVANEQKPQGDESGKSASEKQDEKDDSKKSQPASFEVNYPLGAFGRKDIPEPARLTAFVHATIWTCGAAGVIEDGTLVVADGKIIDVGKDIKIPDGAEVIDVRGTHITPGIIDCHSHAATDGGVNEGTQSITCEVRIGDFVDANDITIYRQLAGGVTAANVLHGSANAIGGQNQVIKLRWGMSGEDMKFTEAPQGVKFALGENVKQSNWGSDSTGRYPQSRMGVEQLYRDAFEAARDYARKMDAWKANRRGLPPRRDLELDALREILDGDRWIHCHSYRQDEILALLRILKEYEITIGTFQHILEGYKVADEMAKAGAMASAFSDWWAYKMEVQDAIPYAGALMHKQGVVVSFNSDDGELARHLNQEAAKAVKYGGVDRQEALKFVTLNPARQLRIDHLVGSIEPGKHADFVVWSSDPLSNFSRCEQTWIDGRRFFHRDDDDRMQKESREKRNVLIQKILESGEDMREPGERDFNASELWPRIDEYCTHFSHLRAQQSAKQDQE